MSPSATSAQNLVMSSSGVGGEASVTLTLADTQGLLSGGLDTVTLNIASQYSAVRVSTADLSAGPCLCVCLAVRVPGSACAWLCVSLAVRVTGCACLAVHVAGCACPWLCVCPALRVAGCACARLCVSLAVRVPGCACPWLCVCPAVRVPGCACVRLCVCPAVRVAGCAGARLCVCPAVRVPGCACARLCVCPVVRVAGCACVRLCVSLAVRVSGCAGARLCVSLAVRAPGCACRWLCVCPAVRVPGCACRRLCVYPAVRAPGCACRWLCVCLAVRVPGCACRWLCGCPAVRVPGCACPWLCVSPAVRVPGCACPWLCVCPAVRAPGCACARLCVRPAVPVPGCACPWLCLCPAVRAPGCACVSLCVSLAVKRQAGQRSRRSPALLAGASSPLWALTVQGNADGCGIQSRVSSDPATVSFQSEAHLKFSDGRECSQCHLALFFISPPAPQLFVFPVGAQLVSNHLCQGQQFPALLTDPSLSGPGGAGSPQVILVSPTPQPSAACEEITYQVTDVSPSLAQGGQPEKEGRLHQCLECGRTFASAALLLHHSKELHGRERIHVCPVCRKAFKRATHLKEHMQTHQAGPSLSSQKPRVFKCDTCEKAFAKPSQLERHSRIHTGDHTAGPRFSNLCRKPLVALLSLCRPSLTHLHTDASSREALPRWCPGWREGLLCGQQVPGSPSRPAGRASSGMPLACQRRPGAHRLSSK
ncbi:hypothetical protein J1605_010369 [Eschrichtius robustus]|uniref:C2H2-type domain-containing protein n=1 Tax=Eschrichtius robustus TaxID=9764 RepID=A0AB34GNP9_ESCRO|nr:hypothetical protein J1605_010369 [Eschrichtius robustus]